MGLLKGHSKVHGGSKRPRSRRWNQRLRIRIRRKTEDEEESEELLRIPVESVEQERDRTRESPVLEELGHYRIKPDLAEYKERLGVGIEMELISRMDRSVSTGSRTDKAVGAGSGMDTCAGLGSVTAVVKSWEDSIDMAHGFSYKKKKKDCSSAEQLKLRP